MAHDARSGMDILSYDESVQLLRRCSVGRVAVHLVGEFPTILHVNYAFDEHDVLFRTNEGSTLHRGDHRTVAFEIDGIDRIYHEGWSVLVVGTLEAVNTPEQLAAYAMLPLGP